MPELLTPEMLALLMTMIKAYHDNSGADEYWFGFTVDHCLYVVPNMPFALLMQFARLERTSSKKGGIRKVRIRARADELRDLLPLAMCFGSEDLLTCEKNKGDALEKLIAERYAETAWKKHDSRRFFEGGDLTIDGKQVQVKFNGGELTTEKVLRKNGFM